MPFFGQMLAAVGLDLHKTLIVTTHSGTLLSRKANTATYHDLPPHSACPPPLRGLALGVVPLGVVLIVDASRMLAMF